MIRYNGFFPSPNMELAICLPTALVICYFLDGVKTKYLQLSVSVTVKSFSCLHGGGSGEEKCCSFSVGLPGVWDRGILREQGMIYNIKRDFDHKNLGSNGIY